MIRFSGGVECTVKSEKSPLRRGLFIPRIKKIPVGVGVLDDPSVPLLQPKRCIFITLFQAEILQFRKIVLI